MTADQSRSKLSRRMRGVFTAGLALSALCLAVTAAAQHVVGVRPGLCSYVRGDVAIAGERFETDGFPNRFLNAGQALETGNGVAEVQLGSLSVVRAGAHSELQLVSADHDQVEIELAHGSLILDLRDRFDRQRVTIRVAGAEVQSDHVGVYRIDAHAGRRPRLKVFDGRATVRIDRNKVAVGEGKLLLLSDASQGLRAFDKNKGDKLDGWATERRLLFARQAPAKKRKRRRGGLVLP